jgi:hypothetical protein
MGWVIFLLGINAGVGICFLIHKIVGFSRFAKWFEREVVDG